MTAIGVMVLAATVTALVAAFFTHRTRSLPAYGRMALVALAAAELLMFRGIEPVATYFTPIAWTAYIFIADAAVLAVRRKSRAHDSPLAFACMALLSIPLWLIFEAYNLRLANWTYVGLIVSLPAQVLGYVWSFATITPAIFVTADLIESFGWWDHRARPVLLSARTERISMATGAILLATPLLVPRPAASYLFACVWLGFIFLLDPVNFRLGLPSLAGDLAEGRRGRLFSLLAAGWVCGWLWEFWNFWAAAKWHYIFPILQDKKIFEMPIPGYFGFLPFALECFVMYVFAAGLLGWIKPTRSSRRQREDRATLPDKPEMAPPPKPARIHTSFFGVVTAALFAIGLLFPVRACAAGLELPAAAKQALDLLYSGQTEEAIALSQQVQKNAPDQPVGYFLEAGARWWQIYCEACEFKWNMIDAWKGTRNADDDAYFALTDKTIQLAEARIASGDSAEMELYAGMGWMLRARILALLDVRRGTAQAAVKGRAHLLRCLALDPEMYDAYAGLGIYNYYVDTLSAIARVLRFFMGIPGGDKQDGIRQLHIAMEKGALARVESRYYLAKNLRNYELDYAGSTELITPLVTDYPRNAFFRLLLADVQAKLDRRELAAANLRAAEQIPVANPVCAQRIHFVAAQELAVLAAKPGQ
jgi:hypothetical protein